MYRKTIDELQKDARDKQVIDLRSEEDFEKETYPGALNIYWEELGERIDEVSKDIPVYLICYTGQKSDEIAQNLQEQGYEAYSVEGGYRAYLRKKLADFMKPDEDQQERLADRAKDVERSIIKKFKKTIWRQFTKAINEYEMIKDGDKIAVCISGGKDSMLMAKLFQELKIHNKFDFEVKGIWISLCTGCTTGSCIFIYWVYTFDMEEIKQNAIKRIDHDNSKILRIEMDTLSDNGDIEKRLIN